VDLIKRAFSSSLKPGRPTSRVFVPSSPGTGSLTRRASLSDSS
jgi:hypothetical protein